MLTLEATMQQYRRLYRCPLHVIAQSPHVIYPCKSLFPDILYVNVCLLMIYTSVSFINLINSEISTIKPHKNLKPKSIYSISIFRTKDLNGFALLKVYRLISSPNYKVITEEFAEMFIIGEFLVDFIPKMAFFFFFYERMIYFCLKMVLLSMQCIYNMYAYLIR